MSKILRFEEKIFWYNQRTINNNVSIYVTSKYINIKIYLKYE